ncbi:MAG TPA: PQQ-binding-like beta-propeller repeat protein [Blastocatellia bacterium]|nr:PQQ-binding-like beta-propeller repeat protein [Blastocatellia bacterium]
MRFSAASIQRPESNDRRFYVLDLAKGAKLWEFNAGGAVSASPAIANGKLYCFG